jgi:hypothetical protein
VSAGAADGRVALGTEFDIRNGLRDYSGHDGRSFADNCHRKAILVFDVRSGEVDLG